MIANEWERFRYIVSPAVWLRSLLTVGALCTFLLSARQAHAGDGIGTVTTSDVTDTSFVVHWTMPDNYEQGSKYEVCLKKKGSLATACTGAFPFTDAWQRNHEVQPGTARSYLVTNVDPDEEYKIKVMCDDCKKKKKSKFLKKYFTANRNKIGVAVVKTGPSAPTDLRASFWASAVDPNHLTVSWKWFGPGSPSSNLHLCVKQRWWPFIGTKQCRAGDASADGGVKLPNVTDTSYTLQLAAGTNWKVYLVDDTRVLGEVKATTPPR
jgi:fibronectin type III domain protein